MNAQSRLLQLLQERSWTESRLSQECGLPEADIGSILRQESDPSVATLETICKGLGITMAQFFSEQEIVELTPDLKELFDNWTCLSARQKSAVIQMLRVVNYRSEGFY